MWANWECVTEQHKLHKQVCDLWPIHESALHKWVCDVWLHTFTHGYNNLFMCLGII
jgi:hypothetical protein